MNKESQLGQPALDQLYQEVIRDHYKDPRNYGKISPAQFHAEGYNPLCGDRVMVDLNLDAQKKVKEVRFRGSACSICMASASMMTEEIEKQDVAKVKQLIEWFRGLMQGTVEQKKVKGDLQALAGVRHFPVRIKCALLPWMTLRDAIEKGAGAKEHK